MPSCSRLIASLAVLISMASGVFAQATDSAGAQPPLIDRAVGDLDPLATSMRRVDPAFGNSPSQDQLFQLQAPDPSAGTPGQFLLQAQDFRATFTQPDYITLTPEGRDLNTAQLVDGAFIELIPPGTVFHLGEAPGLRNHFAPNGPDHRLFRGSPKDGRLGRIVEAQPMDPRRHLDPAPSLAHRAGLNRSSDALRPAGQFQPAGQLQPWVTAQDLREANRVEVPIPDRVFTHEKAPVWSPVAAPAVDLDMEVAPSVEAD
ncbi:MAG: hypothetical protein AAF328_11220 [Planctomycetota bacterium]